MLQALLSVPNLKEDQGLEVDMVDMHSHILWDIDDGAESLEQSLSMAAIAVEQGIDTTVVTPHCIDEENLESFARKVLEKCQKLQQAIDQRDIPLNIVPGTEVYMDPSILEMPGLDKLTIGNTNYILVEMPMGEVPRYAEDFLYHLQLKGYTPIIAHPERNRQIIEEPNILARFIDMGSLTQINTGSISGFFGSIVQQTAEILLTHNMGHLLGTDAHSDRRRGPYMKQAVELLYEWLGQSRADNIIHKNPKTILEVDVLAVDPPTKYRPRKRLFNFLKR